MNDESLLVSLIVDLYFEVLTGDKDSETNEESIVDDDEKFIEYVSVVISVAVDIAKLLVEIVSVDNILDTDSPTLGYVEISLELVWMTGFSVFI